MNKALGITSEQVRAELVKFDAVSPMRNRPAGWVTREELQQHWGISRAATQQRINLLVEEGSAEKGSFMARHLSSGVRTNVYRVKEGANAHNTVSGVPERAGAGVGTRRDVGRGRVVRKAVAKRSTRPLGKGVGGR